MENIHRGEEPALFEEEIKYVRDIALIEEEIKHIRAKLIIKNKEK